MPAESKCSFSGCPKPRLIDRMFCAEHIDNYGVSDVAAFMITDALAVESDNDGKTDEEDEERKDF